MEFKKGDKVSCYGKEDGIDLTYMIGKILYKYVDGRWAIEFMSSRKKFHDANGHGKNGYCWFVSPTKITLFNSKTKGEKKMSIKSLLTRLIDKDTALLMDEVMDGNGTLNMNDPRVQEALMKTDGFRNHLLGILKEEKEEKNKKG